MFFFFSMISSASWVKEGAITISRKILLISSATEAVISRLAATMPPKMETGSAL